jgi:hypothetical protein
MSGMDAEERWFWVWLSIFTVLIGTAPFAYWQGYHAWGLIFAIVGLGGLLMLIRDHLATTASKWPIRVSLKVLAVATLSMLVGQLVGRDIAGYRANSEISSVQWWLFGLTLLLIVVVMSAALSKSKPSKLVIHWANYRAVEGGGEEFQVGDFLRQIISGDSLLFDIENHSFVIGDKNFVPRDPLWGKEKRLQVNYSYRGNPPVTTERREHGRLLLPEDSKIKWLTGEVERINKLYLEANQRASKLQNELADCQNRTSQIERVLSTRPELPLTALQVEAMQLSSELLDFLRRLGPPPAPKYTAEEIDKMTGAQMEALIKANDGDFLEACEYYRPGGIAFTRQGLENQLTSHWTRLLPWYRKVEAAYALELRSKVETMCNRFLMYGFSDNELPCPVEGRDAEKNIRTMASKFWELAYKVGEKGSP